MLTWLKSLWLKLNFKMGASFCKEVGHDVSILIAETSEDWKKGPQDGNWIRKCSRCNCTVERLEGKKCQ